MCHSCKPNLTDLTTACVHAMFLQEQVEPNRRMPYAASYAWAKPASLWSATLTTHTLTLTHFHTIVAPSSLSHTYTRTITHTHTHTNWL